MVVRQLIRSVTVRNRRTAAIALATLLAVCLSAGTVRSAYTATLTNTGDRVGSGMTFTTATAGATTLCTSVPSGAVVVTSPTVACTETGATLPTQTAGGAVNATPATQTTTVTATGTIPPTAGTFAATGCGPAAFASGVSATNPMLARGGVTFAGTGPLTGGTAMTVNGSTGLATSIVSNVATNAALTFGITFRAAPGSAGGPLISLDTSAAQVASNSTNRVIWLDANGNLNAGAYDTATIRRTVSTTGTDYRDGNWHQVVFVISPGVLNLVLSNWRLYVDGAQKQAAATLLASPPAASGYWHAGWGDITSGTPTWASTGTAGSTVTHFSGSLANAFATNAVLEQSALTALYGQTSQSGWQTATAGYTANWPLGDNGRTAYTGTLPGSALPCTWINVTVDDVAPSSCVYPSTATACPALSTTYRLSTLITAGTLPLAPATLATPQTVTTTFGRNTSYVTGFGAGLHLLVPIRITQTTGGFGYALTWAGYRYVI